MSQEALAALAGLHRNYLGGVERGERNVAIDNIGRIAEALGIEPAELLADDRGGQSGLAPSKPLLEAG